MRNFRITPFLAGLAVLATLGCLGCFSTLAWQSTANAPAYLDHPVLEDRILAIGQLDEASRKAVGTPAPR